MFARHSFIKAGLAVGTAVVSIISGCAVVGTAPASAQTAPVAPPVPSVYSLLSSTGALMGYGGAFTGMVASPTNPLVGVTSTVDGHGAYAVNPQGAVFAIGDAVYRGSAAAAHLSRPVVDIARTSDGAGYWLVATDGGIFSYGDAHFYGSTGAVKLNKPIVGMAPTPDGHGYWLVATDGGIFSFGDAHFYGSTGAVKLNKPIVGMAPTPDGHGYWLVATDGGIFSFGDAHFYGSTGAVKLDKPIVGMAATHDGSGYWLVATDGGIFTFGDARYLGSAAGTGARIVGMATGAPGNYDNPLRAVSGLTPERVDEGVDYAGSGPVYALGDGVVLSTTGSWPGGAFISYRLTDGPATGKIVYVAENVTPSVKIGQIVNANTVVGVLHDAYPDMETGWAADRYGDTMAAVSGQWTSADDANSLPTAYGVNFNKLLVSLGAPSGVLEHPTVTGVLAAGWPTW